MAVKNFNTRIRLKYDQNANWKPSEGDGLVLLQGEFGYDATNKNFFIGDGITSSKDLKYVIGESIMADYVANPSDVTLTNPITNNDSLNIALAKLQKQVTIANGVASIDSQTGAFTTGNGISSTNNVLDVITTGYLTVGNSGVDINDSKIDNDYTSTSTTNLATVATVAAALGTLTDTLTGDPGAGKTITAFDEVDGKVTATFAPISITSRQIPDLASNAVVSVKGDGTYLEPATGSVGNVTISHKTRTETETSGTAQSIKVTDDNQSISIITHTFDAAGHETGKTTTAVNFTKITAADLGLSSAMHFIGQATVEKGDATFPAVEGHTGDYEAGDVVIGYNTDKNEYIYDGTNWIVLGDEGSYAQKTVTITGTGALSGGGSLKDNRTITHNTSGVTPGTYATNTSTALTNGGTFKIPQVTVDTYGHVTAASDVTLTLPTITVNNATLSITDGTTNKQIFSADASTDATVTFTGSTGITATVSDNTVTVGHSNSITAGTASGSTGAVDYGETISIPTVTYDAQGHITGKGTTTVTLPAAQTAAEVSYSNTTSGLTADNVQAAIDEVAGTAAGAVQEVKKLKTSDIGQSVVSSGESLEGPGDVTLHNIAKTGNTNDLVQGYTIVFDCGSATTVIDTAE